MSGAKEDSDKEYLYRLWPSRSTFLCSGLAITGPCPCLLGIPFTVVCVPVGLYFRAIVPGAMLWHPIVVYPALASFAVMLYSLYSVTCIDPGILPRRAIILASPPGSTSSAEKLKEALGYNILGIGTPQRDPSEDPKGMVSEEMRKQGYRWCPTCEIVRPPRASHCSWCDHCVLMYDHHCPFLNVCIARRNYKYFIWFAVSVVTSVLLGIGSALAWLTAMEASRPRKPYRRRRGRRGGLRGDGFMPLPSQLFRSVEEQAAEKLQQGARQLGSELQMHPRSGQDATLVPVTTSLLAMTTPLVLPQAAAIGMNDTAVDNALIAAEDFAQRILGMSLRSATFTVSIVAGVLSLAGAILLAYHCYLLRLGKTTKEHWTEGRNSNASKAESFLDVQSSDMAVELSSQPAPPAAAFATSAQAPLVKAKEESSTLSERRTVQSPEPPTATGSENLVAKPTALRASGHWKTSSTRHLRGRRGRDRMTASDCMILCGDIGPRFIDPYVRLSKKTVGAQLALARQSREKYAEQRARYLQEKFNYTQERARHVSYRDINGVTCGCCEGTCCEKSYKTLVARWSHRYRLLFRFLRAVSSCDHRSARAAFLGEKALDV